MHHMQKQKLRDALKANWLNVEISPGTTIGFHREGVTLCEYNKADPHKCRVIIVGEERFVPYVAFRLIKCFAEGKVPE